MGQKLIEAENINQNSISISLKDLPYGNYIVNYKNEAENQWFKISKTNE